MNTEKQIYAQIEEDYTKGFDALFRMYYKSLVLFSCGMTGDLDASEDLVQNVFFKLARDNDKLFNIDPDKLRPYLFTAVRNITYNHIHSNRNKSSLLTTPEPLEWPEEELYDDGMVAEIRRSIEQLPPRTREIIEDVIIGHMRYKDVAAKYSISVNTVKVLLGRGLKKLRAEFGERKFVLFLLLFHEMLDRKSVV